MMRSDHLCDGRDVEQQPGGRCPVCGVQSDELEDLIAEEMAHNHHRGGRGQQFHFSIFPELTALWGSWAIRNSARYQPTTGERIGGIQGPRQARQRLNEATNGFFLIQHDRFRIERRARHLCALGERAIGEFVAEGIEEGDDLSRLLDRLGRYQQFDPAVLRALCGDRFPPRLRMVPG